MLPKDSPFPCQWWGTSLNNVGLNEVRPDVGTYGRYEFANLPPVPFDMRGDFEWLVAEPKQDEHSIGNEKGSDNAKSVKLLRSTTETMGLVLPTAFLKFMETPSLHQRIRSNTDCFLDLCPEPVRSPIGDGYLIRFLADSQGCVFWYLYVTQNGADHSVVSSPGFYGIDAEQWQDELPNPAELVFSAESFEAFICRFWLENEIWFAEWEKTPMPRVGKEYIEQYRSKH